MFLIKGNSGCDIVLLETENQTVVRKSSKKSYAKRLELQSLKQEKFYLLTDNTECLSNIITPKVLNRNFENFFFFEMEFFNGLDLITFFEKAGKNDLDRFADRLFKLLSFEFSMTKELEVSKELIEKSKSTIENVRENEFSKLSEKEVNKCESILKESFSESVKFPVGLCHGDLTFSNIIVDTEADKLCLIDFLDSFIETPFFDVVKLRQDTSFLWTISMHERVENLTKIELCFDYLDRKIHEKFKEWDVYKDYYVPTQILNMLRVDQYTNNTQTAILIKKAIRSLLNENDNANNTSSR